MPCLFCRFNWKTFSCENLHGSNLVPERQVPEHCVMPRTELTFLQLPCGGIEVWMSPTVSLSARDSGRQLCCDNGSSLHFSQHPSWYLCVGAHLETSGHVGIIVVMKTCPLLMPQAKVIQLSSLSHSAPISWSLLSTTHFVLMHSPQHLFGIVRTS